MKLLLKLLLSIAVVIAGIYAATPLWLPDILARQLPPGWQLEELRTGYPGLSGININRLRVQGGVEGGTLFLDAEFQLNRSGKRITVTLNGPAEIRYQDKSGKIEELFRRVVPGLKRTSQPFETAVAELAAGSRFVIEPGAEPLVEFGGGVKLDMASVDSHVNLQAADLQVRIGDFSDLDSMTAEGQIRLEWTEKAPFTFAYDGLDLQADHLSVAAELSAHNGNFISTGSSTIMHGRSVQLNASATQVDVSWQALDLLSRVGKLDTKTQGFATQIDAETWTGFDFDIMYTLYADADVDGSGTVKVDTGPDLPILFSGNTQAERWAITLPAIIIEPAQLDGLLRVAHLELPPSVKLVGGAIELQGEALVADEITAKLSISGDQMDASMQGSSARNASFTLDTTFGNTISADGPVSIETVTLAGGIAVNNILADVNFENIDTFGLKNLYAEVFGGQLNVSSLQFSKSGMEDTTLDFARIKLDRILATVDVKGLEGTGDLDILLPVGSDQTGLYIKNGTFRSNGPGRLAYAKGGLASSNIGLQALENFLYKDFSGSLDYQSDGAYQIAVHLGGSNPDLYDGKAIEFNLNINGSLPALIDTVFLTGNYEQAILQQIRRK